MYVDLVKKGDEFAEGDSSNEERAAIKGSRCEKRDGGTYLDFESLKIPHGPPDQGAAFSCGQMRQPIIPVFETRDPRAKVSAAAGQPLSASFAQGPHSS